MAVSGKPQIPREEELISLLGKYRPSPGQRFYRRLAAAPWHRPSWLKRLPVPLAAALGLVLVFWLVSPTLFPVVAFTNTPTLTYTATPSPTTADEPVDTQLPGITDTPLAFVPPLERVVAPPEQTELPGIVLINW